MNEEILAGLKMAKERGFSPEDSVQSFISAGYNASEVREAASFLAKGFSPLPSTPSLSSVSSVPKEKPITTIQSDAPFAAISQKESKEAPKQTSSKTTLIILILVALVILGVLIPALLFPDKLMGLIDSIFP